MRAADETAPAEGAIHVLVMPAEKAEIDEASDSLGMTTGAFVRAAGALEAKASEKKKP